MIHAILACIGGVVGIAILCIHYVHRLKKFHHGLYAVRDYGIHACVGMARLSYFRMLYIICAFDANGQIVQAQQCLFCVWGVFFRAMPQLVNVAATDIVHGRACVGGAQKNDGTPSAHASRAVPQDARAPLPYAHALRCALLRCAIVYVGAPIPDALVERAAIRRAQITDASLCGWRMPPNQDLLLSARLFP